MPGAGSHRPMKLEQPYELQTLGLGEDETTHLASKGRRRNRQSGASRAAALLPNTRLILTAGVSNRALAADTQQKLLFG